MVDVKVIGQMDNTLDHTFESANRVYDTSGISPTINTCGGGGTQPKLIECKCLGGFGEKKSNSGTQWYQQDRVYEIGDVSLALPANIPGGSYKYLDIRKVDIMHDTNKIVEQSRAEQSRAEQSSLIAA